MSGMALREHDATDQSVERLGISAVRRFKLTTACESLADSMSRNLLPIVAVSVLGMGSAAVGLVNSVGMIAFLVLGVPMGMLADKLSKPLTMMTVSSLLRAAVVFALPFAWLTGWLIGSSGLIMLIASALLIGIADVAYTTGQGLLVPRLVGRAQIRFLFGKIQSITQIGTVAGALMLTAVLAVVAAPLMWWASAAFYLASSAVQRTIQPWGVRAEESVPDVGGEPKTSGLRHLFTQPLLRKVTLANTLTNAAVASANTLLPVFALTTVGLTPSAYAAVGMCGAFAGIAGAASASWIVSRIGLGATRLVASVGMCAGIVLVMAAGLVADLLPGEPVVWLTIQSVLAGSCSSVSIVAGSDLPARLSRPEQLGTVMGAQRTLILGIIPVTSLVMGLLGSWAGLATASYIWLGCAVLAVVPWIFGRVANPQ